MVRSTARYHLRKEINGVVHKKCTTCNEWCEIGRFSKNKLMGDGLQYQCKSCDSKQNRINARRRYERMIAISDEIKMFGCVRCGFDEEPCAVDFHHVDASQKSNTVSRSYSSQKKWREEILKCIPVCANCHRIITKYSDKMPDISQKHGEFRQYATAVFVRHGMIRPN